MGYRLFTDHAMIEKATVELLNGKELATRLQAHLQRQESDDGIHSSRQLANQIMRSFTETLSILSYGAESSQIANDESLHEKPSPSGVKDRRGCYKRRKSLDSWVTMLPTKDDGFGWRKYGQKDIMSSKHPRCYFRCTHKSEGCKATKQVQRAEEDPIMYETTYFNHHTCAESDMISFQSNNITLNQDQCSPNPMSTISSQLVIQEEFKEDNGESDQDVNSHEAKSAMQDQWEDMDNYTGLESLGYKPEWPPIVSCYDQERVGSGLHDLDMEVNQLDDIDYSLYFD